MPKPNLRIQARFGIDFLDTKRVRDTVPREVLKPMARSSGFIRTTARRSMRKGRLVKSKRRFRDRDGKLIRVKRRKPSLPGQPPRVREGSLKRLLLFGFDRSTRSFVIGPQSIAGSPVPATLERGGTVRVVRRDRGSARKQKRIRTNRTVRIKPRPYMKPALDKAIERDVIPKDIRSLLGGN